MNKYILGVIAVVVIGAGISYMILSKKAEGPKNVTAQNTVTEGSFVPENMMQGLGTFRSVLAMGKTISCDVSYTNASTSDSVKGSIYVSGGKFRGDMTTSVAQSPATMHIISDGANGYSWADMPQGHFAVKFDIRSQPSTTAASSKGQFSLDQPVQYSCKPWSLDESVFTPPASEKFIDLQAGKDAAVAPIAIQCSTCDQITDPGPKAQCKQAFSCN